MSEPVEVTVRIHDGSAGGVDRARQELEKEFADEVEVEEEGGGTARFVFEMDLRGTAEELAGEIKKAVLSAHGKNQDGGEPVVTVSIPHY